MLSKALPVPSLLLELQRKVGAAQVILSDRDIRQEIARGQIVIEPFDDACVQPASVDLHLDRRFRIFRFHHHPYIDVSQPLEELTEPVEIAEDAPFIIPAGEFVLASTLETIGLPGDLAALLEGRTSLGRLGLIVHATAGLVAPGFQGTLTLELHNMAKMPIAIYYRMRICQISFLRLSSMAERPYGSAALGSKYQGQNAPTGSRAYQEFASP